MPGIKEYNGAWLSKYIFINKKNYKEWKKHLRFKNTHENI